MRSMVMPIVRNELSKAVRRKMPVLGVLAVALVCLLIFSFTEGMGSGREINGWGFVGLTMQACFSDAGLIFLAIFSATLLAEENGTGTIRMVLSSPVRRRELFMAKALTGLGYMVVLTMVVLVVAVALGAWRYEFSAISDIDGLIYGRAEVLANFALAFAVNLLPLAAVVIFGLFISTVTKTAGQAIGATVGILVLTEASKHFVTQMAPYLFTSYIGKSWVIFHEVAQGVDYAWTPDIWDLVKVCGGYCVGFFLAGLIVFSRRDLND